MLCRSLVLGSLLTLLVPALAQAQVRPFYPRYDPIVFEPVIDTVLSGTAALVQPTVSHDRKYVTLGMNVQQSQVVRIENFAVQQVSGLGFGNVGGAQPAPLPPGGAPDPNASAPVRPGNAPVGNLLNRAGMTRIDAPR